MAAVRGVRIYNGKIRVEVEEEVRAEHEQLKAQGVEFIYPRHPDFPPHLLEIAPMLFIKGQRKLLTSDGVAIVGSRNVSETGIRVARGLAAELANAGLNVVSGYAKGVDSEAHLGALTAEGTTIMVLPYGIKELRQKNAFREFGWQRNVLAVSQFDPDSGAEAIVKCISAAKIESSPVEQQASSEQLEIRF